MKVYVAMQRGYEETHILGVFTTMEAAEAQRYAKDETSEGSPAFIIEAYELDQVFSWESHRANNPD